MMRLMDTLLFPLAVFGVLCLVALLVGCTLQQQQQATTYQQQIAFACGVAMTLAPVAGPYAPWIIAGCATEEAIAKLALNPNSLNWVDGLIADARRS